MKRIVDKYKGERPDCLFLKKYIGMQTTENEIKNEKALMIQYSAIYSER